MGASSDGGRIFSTAGDSVVAEYQSAVEAMRSAVEIQNQILEMNKSLTQTAVRLSLDFCNY